MEKQKEIISGVYQIRNTKTEKLYIGSSKDIYKRFKEHMAQLKTNKHHSRKLQASYNRCKDKSVFVFELVEIISDMSLLKKREQYYIDKYDAFANGYNCSAIVDNPKYTEKNLRKARKKKNQIESHKRFWELYDDNCIIMGNTFLNRIKDKHYDIGTMNKLIGIIEWFYSSYDKSKYIIVIKYRDATCWLYIYDLNNNKFAVYCAINKNIYLSESDTKFYIEKLKENNLFSEAIHTPVETKVSYSSFRKKS